MDTQFLESQEYINIRYTENCKVTRNLPICLKQTKRKIGLWCKSPQWAIKLECIGLHIVRSTKSRQRLLDTYQLFFINPVV